MPLRDPTRAAEPPLCLLPPHPHPCRHAPTRVNVPPPASSCPLAPPAKPPCPLATLPVPLPPLMTSPTLPPRPLACRAHAHVLPRCARSATVHLGAAALDPPPRPCPRPRPRPTCWHRSYSPRPRLTKVWSGGGTAAWAGGEGLLRELAGEGTGLVDREGAWPRQGREGAQQRGRGGGGGARGGEVAGTTEGQGGGGGE